MLLLQRTSPLLAQSRHAPLHCTCPLSGVKQTSCFALHVSAFDPKRTLTARFCGKRGEFIMSLGGAAVMAPLAAPGQQETSRMGMMSLIGADAAAPPDAMKLDGTTEATLARSLSALPPDEGGGSRLTRRASVLDRGRAIRVRRNGPGRQKKHRVVGRAAPVLYQFRAGRGPGLFRTPLIDFTLSADELDQRPMPGRDMSLHCYFE